MWKLGLGVEEGVQGKGGGGYRRTRRIYIVYGVFGNLYLTLEGFVDDSVQRIYSFLFLKRRVYLKTTEKGELPVP